MHSDSRQFKCTVLNLGVMGSSNTIDINEEYRGVKVMPKTSFYSIWVQINHCSFSFTHKLYSDPLVVWLMMLQGRKWVYWINNDSSL